MTWHVERNVMLALDLPFRINITPHYTLQWTPPHIFSSSNSPPSRRHRHSPSETTLRLVFYFPGQFAVSIKMGNCCVSSATEEPPQNTIRKTLPPTHPLPEEETVKEVLSETPAVRKNPPPVLANGSHHPKSSSLPAEKRRESDKKPSAGMVFTSDGIAGEAFASEIRGSVPMPTATDKRDHEDDVVNARRRSPARVQKWSVPDKNGVGRSPSRRFEPSPGRARSSPGRDPGQGSPYNASRMENGESSYSLRSRSPVIHAENGNARGGLGRSPSAMKTGRSLDRVRSELGDKSRRLEESYSSRESSEKWPPTYSNESLENPLVSLECFIFL